jgi:NAD kinase
MAAGGPVLCVGTQAFVCSPLAMHGGSAAPLVVPAGATLTIDVQPSYAGFNVEIDGHLSALDARAYRLTMRRDKARMVSVSRSDGRLHRLRQRGLIADSPRVLIRDQRTGR